VQEAYQEYMEKVRSVAALGKDSLNYAVKLGSGTSERIVEIRIALKITPDLTSSCNTVT
jgi:hypothetical protein